MEFKEWQKISRLNRDIVITEKIDGTNGCIYNGADGEFRVGSRTQWITPEKDNYGFAKWAYENKEELKKLGEGYHHGEWWGSGCQRGYGLLKGEKRFSLFNVYRWAEYGQPLKQYPTKNPKVFTSQEYAPKCCHVVPVLYEGGWFVRVDDDMEYAPNNELFRLRIHGSVASSGFMKPEGIVIYHKASSVLFKVTLEKDEKPKGSNEV